MRYGILIVLAVALLLLFPFRLEEDTETERVMEDYPWVRFAHAKGSPRELHYLSQIEYLADKDRILGMGVAQTVWVRDYLLPEEGDAIDLLREIAECDLDVARNTSETFWFRDSMTPEKVEFMRNFSNFTCERAEIARTVSKTKWFILFVKPEGGEALRILADMDADLASSVVGTHWFSEAMTEREIDALREIEEFSLLDSGRTQELMRFFQPTRDGVPLARANDALRAYPEFYERYFSVRPLAADTLSSFASLASIRMHDVSLSESLLDETPVVLAHLDTISNRNGEAARFLYENFGPDERVLRFAATYLAFRPLEDMPSFFESCLFVSHNPEFVYEDTTEAFRYDLLVHALSALPTEDAYAYKSLLFEATRLYGNRFYEWDDLRNGKVYGWSSDRKLSPLEAEGFDALLAFLIGRNEEGVLATDIRLEKGEYLLALLDIPYEYLINYDGTIVENKGDERGTYYIYAIVYNIRTLSARARNLSSRMEKREIEYHTALTDYIMETGDKKDVYYLLINSQNWDVASRGDEKVCVHETYQTVMDAIAMGIAPSMMYWKSEETGHLYPAYLASPGLLRTIEKNGAYWGSPFAYKGYISPYDPSGYRGFLAGDIEYVSIYDHQAQTFVTIHSQLQATYSTSLLLALLFLLILVLAFWLSRKK